MKYRPAFSRRSLLASAPMLASLPMGFMGFQPADAAEPFPRGYYPEQTSWPDEPPYTPAAEGWVDVDGARLWYQDGGGTGVPIVLLHASTGSAASWRYQQARFSKEGYRVIAYSRRGHYRSTRTDSAAKVSGAADLLQLSTKLKLPPFHLVGLASGGFVAMDFALSHPQRLRSLVIASSLSGIDEPEFVAVVRRLLTPEFMALPHHIKELGPSYRALNAKGTERWIELEKMASEGTTALPPKDNFISWKALQRLRPPTMFLTGDAYLYMPPAFFTMIKRHLPRARYVVLGGAGHATPWEQPQTFNAALLSFLARR